MFNPKSEYALNKLDQDAIVCPSATGIHIRLTREDFDTEEEFRFWKDFSDSDYRDTEATGRGYYDNCISLVSALECTGISADDILLLPILEEERCQWKTRLSSEIRNQLTEKQYRRLCRYYLDKLTEKEIAHLEGIGQQRISASLISGKKVLEKILKKFF